MDKRRSLEDLFGGEIYRYTDDQAIDDGILVPFKVESKDTRHRITRNALDTLASYYRNHGYAAYQERDFTRFFFAELLPLIPHAHETYCAGSILETNYDFSTSTRDDQVLWYVPNELGGVTMMLPEDY